MKNSQTGRRLSPQSAREPKSAINVSQFLFPAPVFLSLTYADRSNNKLIKNKVLAYCKSETIHRNLLSLVRPFLGTAWDCQLETGQQKFVESHVEKRTLKEQGE